MIYLRTLVIATLIAAIAGCTSGASTANSSSQHPEVSASVTSSSPARTSNQLTGFGATQDDWASAHQPDADFDAGSVYDQDPSLPSINGHTGARYTGVTPLGGRVTDYQLNFPAGTRLTAAKAELLEEFPADTTMVWEKMLGTCYGIEYRSKTLAMTLGLPYAAGQVGVALSGPDGHDLVSSSSEVGYAILGASAAATPADFGGC